MAIGAYAPPQVGERLATPARPRRDPLSKAEHRRMARRVRLRREATAWGFLGPMFFFFVVFLVVPTLGVLWWSTQSGGLVTGTKFVGLNNYTGLPGQILAATAITNTFKFALMSIPLILVFAFGIAMLLSRVKRGGAVYRFLVYFPVLVPGVVAALIWIFLTNVDFGLFNTVLRSVGQPKQVWLGAGLALPMLALLDVWRNVGYWAIFFLAAIIGLPEELYQAAQLDGAGLRQRFLRITLPLMRRMILFALVVATIWGLQIFDTPAVLTDGGPGTATVTVVYQVWRYAIGSANLAGLAAAISVALLLVILVLTLVQLRALRGPRGEL
jgi:multiple sugar transport system permease protein